MLPKENRVRASSFDTLLKKTRSIQGQFVSVAYAKHNDEGLPSAYAVIASKAVAKQAVARNKLRRWGYSLIREFGLHSRPGILCFIFFKKGSKDVLYRELKEDLAGLFKKAQLL